MVRLAITCILAGGAQLGAATCTWTGLGGNDNWSNGQNWSTNPTAPAAGDDLVFSGSTRLTPTNDIAAGTTFKSITIALGAGNFVIGGNALTLSGGATALASNTTSGTITINTALTFSTAAPTVTSTAGGTLVLGGTIDNGGLLLTVAAGGPTTLSGVISGTGGLTKNSAGTLFLSGANTYTGANTVAAGTLQLSGSGTLGGAAGVTAASLTLTGAVLDLNNVATDLGVGSISVTGGSASSITNIANGHSFTATGAVSFNATGTSVVSGNGAFVINSPASNFNLGTSVAANLSMASLNSFTAAVSSFIVANNSTAVSSTLTLALASNTITASTISIGASGSNVAASGTMQLGTANTLAANTFVVGQKRSDGTISFQAGLTTPTVTITDKTGGATAAITLGEYNSSPGGYTPAGTMNFTGGTVTAQIGTLVCGRMNPNGVISSSASATGTLTIDGAGSTVSITTARLGQWAINKDDTATSLAAGTITVITGAVTIGTLAVGDKGSFGFAGNAFNKSTGTVNVQGGSLTVNTAFTLGDQTIYGTAASQVTTVLNITGGTVTSNVDITTSTTASAPVKSSLTLNGGTLNMGGHAIGTAAATIGTGGGAISWSSGTATAIGTINGTDGLTKGTAGTLIMTGTSSYTGATTISAGTLQLGNTGTSGALPASSALTDNGALVFNRTDTITQATDFPSVISGSGTVTQSGTGTVVLNGANTYTGTTTVQKGTLSFSSIASVGGGASALGAPTTVAAGTIALGSTTNGATLRYTGTGSVTDRVRDFAGTTGGVTIDQSGTGLLKFTSAPTVSGAGLKTLTLQGSTAGTGEIAAAIGDGASAISVTKAGTGTWTLSGACTYTGATTVSGGTLLVTGSTSASSAVTVASAATLGGSGTVGGTIAINAGGTLAPGTGGTSIGTLTAGTTTLNATATYVVDLDGTVPTYDRLTTAGTVTCAGTLTVSSIANSAYGKAYPIIDAGTVTGTFSGWANGVAATQSGRRFRIAYTAATVTLTDVPQIYIWTGGGSDVNWSTPANWDNNLAPPAGSDLVFAGSTRLTPNNDYAAGTSFASISFSSGAGNFVIGGNALTLTGGTTALSSSATSGTMTISNNLTFATAAPTITSTSGGALALSGTIDNGGLLLTVAAGASTSISNVISGSGGLTKSGSGTLTLGGVASTQWSGATTINGGTLVLGTQGSGNWYQSTSWTINGGGTLRYASADVVIDAAVITVNAGGMLDFNNSSDAIGYIAGAGTIALGSATLTLDLPATGSGSNFSGVMSGSGNLVVRGQQGSGTQILSGANTYTGTTAVRNGTLSINSIQSVAGGASAVGAPTTAVNGTIALGSTTTTGVLTYTGTGNTTDRVIDLAGTTGGGSIGQSGTGLLKFTSNMTATGVGAKTLTLRGSTAGTGEIAGAIVDGSGTTSLVKLGTGTWTLSGTTTHTGTTTVSAGTLLVTGSTTSSSAMTVANAATLGGTGTVAGSISLSAGATLAPGTGGTTIGTLTTGSVTCNATSTYSVDLDGTTPTCDAISTVSAVTCAGTLTVASVANASYGKAYTIITAGSVNGTFSGLADGACTTQNGRRFKISYTATTVTLTDVPQAYVWTGGGANDNWSTAANWDNNIAPPAGSDLIFAGSTRLTPNNDMTAGTSFSSISFSSGAGDFVIGGNALTLSGGGTAMASSATSGTMTMSNALAFSTSAPTITTVASGALVLNGAVDNGGMLLTVAAGGSTTVGGTLSGSGGITKTGSNVLTLSGANTFTGAVTVSAGIVVAGSNSAFGTAAGGVTVSSGAQVDLATGVTVAGETITVSGNGIAADAFGYLRTRGALQADSSATATWGGSIVLGADRARLGAQANGTLRVTGVVDDGINTYALDVSTETTGRVVLATPVTYGGTTDIVRGVLALGATNALPTSSTLDIRSASLVVDASSFDLAGFDQTVGILQQTATDAGSMPVTNSAVGTTSVLTVNGTVDKSFPGYLQDGAGKVAFTKAGTSTIFMSGANTHTGATTISGGTLRLGNGTTVGSLSPSSAITDNAILSFNRTDVVTQGTDFASVIAGTGALIQVGTGTLVLNGANTYTGTTAIQKGTLSIASIANVGGGASAVGAPTTAGNGIIAMGTTTNNATLLYTGSASTTDRVLNLASTTGGVTIDQSGSGLLKFTSAMTATGAGAKTLTLQGSTAGTGELAGALVDSSSATSVTKAGTGTWTLSGVCTYTGTTTINGGTLLVTGSTAAGSAVAVASGATLGGSGTIAGTVAVNAGATLAPGTGGTTIATLTTGAVTFDAASTYSVDVNGIGPTCDRVTTSAAVTCAGTLTVASASNGAPGQVHTIISAGSVSGIFSGLADGALFIQAGRGWRINYTATTVTLTDTVIPVIIARQTLDTDANGHIDRIRLTYDQALNDNFAGLTITVAGYTVGTPVTGAVANDAIIELPLTELGIGDTGSTPMVRTTANTTLGYASGTGLALVEGSGTAATDGAAPVLMSASWTDGGSGGVGAGDTVTLTFSESVVASSMVVADLGLPVSGDTLSSATIANQSGPTVDVVLAGTPILTPGGLYSPAATTAGRPSGIFLAANTHLHDGVGLAGAVGSAATAVDIAPTTSTVSIAWASGSDPKPWALGALAVGTTGDSISSGLDLVIGNVGDCNVDLTIASAASTPSGWVPAGSAGTNAYLMKAETGAAPVSAPTDPASYGLTLGTVAQPLTSGLLTGRTCSLKLYFQAPTTITSGSAVQQTVAVTITAALAP